MPGAVGHFLGRAKDFITAMMQPAEFVCGDCERNRRCGLPPHQDCIERVIQVESDPDGAVRRAKQRAQLLRQEIDSV